MTTTAQTLTPASLALFIAFASDAPNWNGEPLVDISAEERGNLTQLKKAGLVETFKLDGDQWIRFTTTGLALAKEHGYDLTGYGNYDQN